MSDKSASVPTVVVREYLHRDEAEIARAHLGAEGIPAVVRADDEGGLNPGFFTEYRVALVVNAADAFAARDVLGFEQPLAVPSEIRRAILAHAGWAYPNEGCGLLAGNELEISMVFCLTNRQHSRNGYTIDPKEHFGAMRYAERIGLSIVGAWHSHPDGDARLSSTDVAASPGGSWITVVVGNRAPAEAALRAFRTEGDRVFERQVVTSLPGH